MIKAPESVDPAAVAVGAEIVSAMLSGRPDIATCMMLSRADLAIVSRNHPVTTLPEHRYLRGTSDATGRSRDNFSLRGLGAIRGRPTSSAGEEQLLGQWESHHAWYPYRGWVAAHEFAHGIQNLCFTPKDHEEWDALYSAVAKEERYHGNYMLVNVMEFFAILSSAYFEATNEIPDIRDRDDLKASLPDVYRALQDIYGDAVLPQEYRTAHQAPTPAVMAQVEEVNMERFDEALLELMDKYDIPGGAVAVVKDGRLVLARGYGVGDVDSGEPVQPDSLFRIASISKPITAVAILWLVESGDLDLDDRAFDILNDYEALERDDADPRIREVTVRQLLQHSGGWDRDKSFDAMWIAGRVERELGVPKPVSCADIITFMLKKSLDFDPGARYSYSNLGYCILGRIIEEVSGQPYEEYVRNQLLLPIGIARMRIGGTLPDDRADGEVSYYGYPGQSWTWSVLPGTEQQVPWPYGGFHLKTMDSHGGWIASTIDLVRFATALGGRPPLLLERPSIAQMLSRPDLSTRQDRASYYGMGWSVRPWPGGANWWHFGSMPGSESMLVRTHNGMVWAALFNSRPENRDGFIDEIDRLLWDSFEDVERWPAHDLFTTYGYGDQPAATPSPLDTTETYEDERFGWTMDLPSGWQVTEKTELFTRLQLHNHFVYVEVSPLQSEVNIKGTIGNRIRAWREWTDNWQTSRVVRQESETLGGVKSYWIHYQGHESSQYCPINVMDRLLVTHYEGRQFGIILRGQVCGGNAQDVKRLEELVRSLMP